MHHVTPSVDETGGLRLMLTCTVSRYRGNIITSPQAFMIAMSPAVAVTLGLLSCHLTDSVAMSKNTLSVPTLRK